jgi:hypothetical protein
MSFSILSKQFLSDFFIGKFGCRLVFSPPYIGIYTVLKKCIYDVLFKSKGSRKFTIFNFTDFP